MYMDPCNSYVRERVETLREEAARERLAARAGRGPGIWSIVRSALGRKLLRDGEGADGDAV
ncbi:MAG TPA: hypothetical protein VFE37_16780 [Chloroflexota bacterium]|nr:hypothetical protein [Chloroflexota bacterium]